MKSSIIASQAEEPGLDFFQGWFFSEGTITATNIAFSFVTWMVVFCHTMDHEQNSATPLGIIISSSHDIPRWICDWGWSSHFEQTKRAGDCIRHLRVAAIYWKEFNPKKSPLLSISGTSTPLVNVGIANWKITMFRVNQLSMGQIFYSYVTIPRGYPTTLW